MPDEYRAYLDRVCDYAWEHEGRDDAYTMREKRYMDEALELLDFTPLAALSRAELDDTRALILRTLEHGEKPYGQLEARRRELHAKVFAPGGVRTAQQVNLWQAFAALFPATYNVGGDTLIEAFTEALPGDFGVEEQAVARLLYKHFADIIDAQEPPHG